MTTQHEARTALHAELMAGEDPTSPEYTDAEARIQRLIDDHRDQVLAEAAELVLADAEAQYQRSFSDNRIFEFNGGKRARGVLLAARTTSPTAQEA
ncbi:hypothetical protein LN042_11585 [Kitasatospora sp. RB6PN24]|uniref:hypothetical protein n=1 Tax=Kitasatospora humi TaxID=2893891 RepID=UPI001E2FAE98|nr:hypothetical protein [Kitasatospora humi]MCC9307731.1 hypothetical protein [Kitasatospora humi]